MVLPHRVSFKSGSQKPDRIPGVVLFLLISWSVDRTLDTINMSELFRGISSLPLSWPPVGRFVKMLKLILFQLCHVTHCYLMALPGSSRLLSGSVISNIRVEVLLSYTVQTPSLLTARLPAIIVILVAAKVIWLLQQDLELSVNYQSFFWFLPALPVTNGQMELVP